MSDQEKQLADHIESRVSDLVNEKASELASGSLRNFVTLITLAFLAGGWATKMTLDMHSLTAAHEQAANATQARITDWTAWRTDVTASLNKGDRFTSRNYEVVASMFNQKNPPVMLPYFHEIKDK